MPAALLPSVIFSPMGVFLYSSTSHNYCALVVTLLAVSYSILDYIKLSHELKHLGLYPDMLLMLTLKWKHKMPKNSTINTCSAVWHVKIWSLKLPTNTFTSISVYIRTKAIVIEAKNIIIYRCGSHFFSVQICRGRSIQIKIAVMPLREYQTCQIKILMIGLASSLAFMCIRAATNQPIIID